MVLSVLVLICAGMTARIKFGTLALVSAISKKASLMHAHELM